jgi:hypothetical protein
LNSRFAGSKSLDLDHPEHTGRQNAAAVKASRKPSASSSRGNHSPVYAAHSWRVCGQGRMPSLKTSFQKIILEQHILDGVVFEPVE